MRLRRTLGDAATDGCPGGGPARDDGDARRGAADARPGSTPGRSWLRAPPSGRPGTTCAASPTSPAAACPATCRGRCRPASAARLDPAAGRCRRSCACSARSAGSTTTELRATFNGGLGMVARRCRRPRSRSRSAALAGDGVEATARRRGRRRPTRVGGARYARGRRWSGSRERPPRIAVGVSGAGSNLRALAAAAGRGELGGDDRPGLRRSRLPGARLGGGAGDRDGARPGRRRRDAGRRRSRPSAPDVVVLAGYMRIVGPAVLAAFAGRILNTHPSLLPAFPGAHAVADALAHGVDRHRLHGPPRRRDARRRPDRRPGGGRDPARTTTRRPSTSGSGRSSTGCCRGPSRCCWPARSPSPTAGT